jgi:Uma2 family endonuclease
VSVAESEPATMETVADLIDRLGGIPAERIRMRPAPGTATEDDLIRRLYAIDGWISELVDGVLIDKALSVRNSVLATHVICRLCEFGDAHGDGFALTGKVPFRLRPARVRLPNASYVLWDSIPGDDLPDEEISSIPPALAVDFVGAGNTTREFQLKREDYFAGGVRVAWLIDPANELAEIHAANGHTQVIGPLDELTARDVLPGFRLPLSDVFASARRKKRKPR